MRSVGLASLGAPPVPPAVLVVEDEPLIRMLLADALIQAGLVVVEAGGADEALVLLEGDIAIDLVMTDVRMAGSMDGLGLAQVVRETRPHIKIVVASGHVSARPSSDLADAFFPKPFALSKVAACVLDLLGDRAP